MPKRIAAQAYGQVCVVSTKHVVAAALFVCALQLVFGNNVERAFNAVALFLVLLQQTHDYAFAYAHGAHKHQPFLQAAILLKAGIIGEVIAQLLYHFAVVLVNLEIFKLAIGIGAYGCALEFFGEGFGCVALVGFFAKYFCLPVCIVCLAEVFFLARFTQSIFEFVFVKLDVGVLVGLKQFRIFRSLFRG